MEKEPHSGQPGDFTNKHDKSSDKELEKMCVAANRVIDLLFPVMESAHKEISSFYNNIRERALSGGVVVDDDLKVLTKEKKRLNNLNPSF